MYVYISMYLYIHIYVYIFLNDLTHIDVGPRHGSLPQYHLRSNHLGLIIQRFSRRWKIDLYWRSSFRTTYAGRNVRQAMFQLISSPHTQK